MLDAYYDVYPYEAIGWLLFSGEIIVLENEHDGLHKFSISERQVASALDINDISPNDIFAIWHTHPTREATPSADDRSFMAALHEVWPGKVHIILDHDGHRIWTYDGEVKEIPHVATHQG